MSPKKVKESRTRYTAQDASAKQSRSKRSSASKAIRVKSKPGTASRRSHAVRTKAVFVADGSFDVINASGGLDEINQNLLELKAGLVDIQQRMSAFEKQMSSLSDAQKLLEVINKTTADDLGWLSLSESAFAFWENTEDDIYDTL
jgi:hypothetical protein